MSTRINLFHFPKTFIPLLSRAARETLRARHQTTGGNIAVILVSNDEIRCMNRKFRKVNRVTDVISFMYSSRPLSGDIFIARGRSRMQAKNFHHPWGRELAYLVIHGILHLLGETDYTPRARKKMFKQQDTLFACLFS